jgi:curved DNA-binding protein CbpA
MENIEIDKYRNYSANPFEILGVARDADDETIRKAFSDRQGEDRSRFSRDEIEEAYDLIKDSRSRGMYRLLSPKPLSSLEELRRLIRPRPKYIGPGIWMKTLKELSEKSTKGETHERCTGQVSIRRDPDGILWDKDFRSIQRN